MSCTRGFSWPDDRIHDESRLVAALEWSGIELGEEAALTPLVEYGHLRNARGLKDREERSVLASLVLVGCGQTGIERAGGSELRGFRRKGQGVLRVLAVGLLIAIAIPAQAKYTDEVVLWDGNTINGEIKGLQQGRLELKINKAGTVYAEWDRVHFLTSNKQLEVEDRRGEFYYGSLGTATGARELVVVGPQKTTVLEMDRVVRIQPIRQRFWDRVDGTLSLGLNFVSAQTIFKYSFEVDATYRQEKYSASVKLGLFQTRQEGTDDVIRDDLDFDYTRYFGDRYFGTGTLAFSRSSELGIDLRGQIGYAFGRAFVQSNRTRLWANGGLAVSREKPVGEDPAGSYLWATVSGAYRFFLYSYPKTDIKIDLRVLPAVTDWPRWRAEVSAAVSREIVEDFAISFSVFDNYDSNPPAGAASNHDFGTVLSVGWKF